MTVDILYLGARGQGWGPVDELAQLASEVFDARLFSVKDRGEVSTFRKVTAYFPRRRRSARSLLVIAANPALLAYVSDRRYWLTGYEQVAAWVIDSFWTDRVSLFARTGKHFDHLFVTDRDLTEEWSRLTRTPVYWAPWGADTLQIEHAFNHRSIDLLRVGRQPKIWNDDEVTAHTAKFYGIEFHGRPPMARTGDENQKLLRDRLRESKFVLAFHNLISPAPYTHPTRDYLTGRWMDALAAGATVVGAAPVAATYTLWPGATVEIEPNDLDLGMRQVRDLVSVWTPEHAEKQRQQARSVLDWRLRLRDIARVMELSPPKLEEQLRRLGVPLEDG